MQEDRPEYIPILDDDDWPTGVSFVADGIIKVLNESDEVVNVVLERRGRALKVRSERTGGEGDTVQLSPGQATEIPYICEGMTVLRIADSDGNRLGSGYIYAKDDEIHYGTDQEPIRRYEQNLGFGVKHHLGYCPHRNNRSHDR